MIQQWHTEYGSNPVFRLRANTFVVSVIPLLIYLAIVSVSNISMSFFTLFAIPLLSSILISINEVRDKSTNMNLVYFLRLGLTLLVVGVIIIVVGGFLLLGGIAGIFAMLGIPTGTGGTILFSSIAIISFGALSVITIEVGLLRRIKPIKEIDSWDSRIVSLKKDYQSILENIENPIYISQSELPSIYPLNYSNLSDEELEVILTRLENAKNIYKKYMEVQKPINNYSNNSEVFISSFKPLSYDSEEKFNNDIELLDSALSFYNRYESIIKNISLKHLEERKLTPPVPNTVEELSDKVNELELIVDIVSEYIDAASNYNELKSKRDIEGFGELQEAVDDELSQMSNINDMQVMRDKLRQIGRLFATHSRFREISNSDRKYSNSFIQDFTKNVFIGKYTQNTKRSIDAYVEYVEALKTIEQHSELDNTTKTVLRDVLNSCSPLESPQETITQAAVINESVVVLSQLETTKSDMLLPAYEELHSEVLDNIESKTVSQEDISDYAELITTVKNLARFLENNRTHPTVDADEWESEILRALNERFPQRLKPLDKQRERMLNNYWERDDLYEFDWQEFEELIGTLFEAEGYDVKVTEGTRDLGVDVYAEDKGTRVAIQVKQFAEGNRVGREPLQKLASTLANDSADEVVVITSSTFAKTAKDYARDFGSEMQLIDGSELIHRLVDAEVPPPS